MTIAVVAHDDRKLLAEQFCTAYKGILNDHTLIATNVTAHFLEQALGRPIRHCMSGAAGGKQQIASMLSYNEIDLLLFFRSPIQSRALDADDRNILRICDRNCIPYATNLATAEALLLGLQNGDLSWREIFHPEDGRK